MVTTIKDVAAQAGVSKSTVSQFLNKRYNFMSLETKARVAAAVKELDYHPNQIARSLKKKKSNLVAIVASNLSSRFTTELVAVIEKVMNKQGIDVIVAATQDDSTKERNYVNSFIAKQVDGIFVFPTSENTSFYQQIIAQNYPIVFLDRKLDSVNISSVLLDNTAAVKECMNLLFTNGHTKIGILTFPVADNLITTRVERLSGYRDFIRDNGLVVNESYIKSGVPTEIPILLDELFKLKNKPSAIIATNDILLELLLVWVNQNHVKVPEELSIVGIDDVSFAKLYQPAISTLEQPIKKIGETAAQILIEEIKKSKAVNSIKKNVQIVRFQGYLHKRESVKLISNGID